MTIIAIVAIMTTMIFMIIISLSQFPSPSPSLAPSWMFLIFHHQVWTPLPFLVNIIVFSCNLQVYVKILVKKYPPSWLSSLARGFVSCCCCMRSLCLRLRLSGHQGVRSNRPLLRCPSGTCEYHQAGSVQTNVQDVQLPGQTFRVFEVLCGQLSQQRMRPTCFNVPKRFQSPGTFGFARWDSGIRFAWPNLAIRYLISKGANPNVVDKNGETAQLGCWSAGQD